MNRYLAMLHQADKKIEAHQTDTLQNLQNPDDGSFVGFEGMPSSEYENFKTIQDDAPNQTENSAQTDFNYRYAHLITCQQCEHLSLTGTCTLKGTQMYPDAKRDCTSFNVLETERIHIENTPYSYSQMQGFLAKYEKPLFYHLVDCVDCDFEATRYCADILKVGRGYNIMLSYFDDELARREALLAQVVKARISGRKVFVLSSEGNISPPC